MSAHQYQDGNDASPSQVPAIVLDRTDSADDLQDQQLQPQTIQWDAQPDRSPNVPPRRPSTSNSRRPRGVFCADSTNPDGDRRPSYSEDSESERDLALASPTLPPSAMPPVFSDNRSFQDNRSFKD